MNHKISKLLGKPTLEGQVGESHVWDGPLDTTGFPMGSGSSSGITDMQDPFAGKTFSIVESPANMKGNAKPVFNESTSDAAAMMLSLIHI